MAAPPEKIRERIAQVVHTELSVAPSVARDVAFHMTDWLDDFTALGRFLDDPSSPTDTEVCQLLMQFLVHVPNHLAAASRLATGIPVTDVFGVGATTDDQD